MSGFLHRLAALAMGSGESSLHSVARLPYAIPPSLVRDGEAERQAATPGARVNDRHPTAYSGAELDHVPNQNQPGDSFRTETDAQALKNEVIPSSPEALIAPSATGFITKPGLEMSPSPVKSTPRQAGTGVKKTASGESPDRDEIIKTHSPLNSSVTIPTENSGSYVTLTDNATPPPLLPLQNTVYPPAFNSHAVAQPGEPRGAKWQSQVEETTEVHVSIGRIEVTAVHEAPPPKRQAPASAKPMTLDEYLARRQRQA